MLGSLFGRPKDIAFRGNMGNFRSSDYTTNPNLLASAGNIGQRASTLGGYGGQFMNQYQQMLDPNSQYNQSRQSQLATQIGDQTSRQFRNQQQALAARGIGGGGMSSLLGMAGQNRANEAIRQGSLGLQDQALGQAARFGQMGVGAETAAGNLAAQQAQQYGQIDARNLQNQQFNTQGQNQYQQYIDMGNYNAAVQNQNAQGAWANNMLGLGAGLLTAPLTGGAGAAGAGVSLLGSLFKQ